MNPNSAETSLRQYSAFSARMPPDFFSLHIFKVVRRGWEEQGGGGTEFSRSSAYFSLHFADFGGGEVGGGGWIFLLYCKTC
jgi:hypothetical protein